MCLTKAPQRKPQPHAYHHRTSAGGRAAVPTARAPAFGVETIEHNTVLDAITITEHNDGMHKERRTLYTTLLVRPPETDNNRK